MSPSSKRACVFCGSSLAGRRRQARHCSGACRAAASRARAAEPVKSFWTTVGQLRRPETAQKRTDGTQGVRP